MGQGANEGEDAQANGRHSQANQDPSPPKIETQIRGRGE